MIDAMKKLSLFTLLFAGLLTVSAAELRREHYSIESTAGGLTVKDAGGTPVLRIGRQSFAWSPPVAVPEAVEASGDDTLLIRYKIENDATGEISLKGILTTLPEGKFRIDWELSAPASVRTGGIMQELRPEKGVEKPALYKSGLWTRSPNGGVPFEARDGYYRPFAGASGIVWMRIAGNAGYTSPTAEHLNYKKDKEGKLTARMEFLVTEAGVEGFAAAARFNGRPAAVAISTDNPFNLWESGEPEFTVKVASNTPGELEVVARDYDGKVVLNEKKMTGGAKEFSYRLPAAERAIYFIEVKYGEAFCRSTAGILPPHTYRERESRIFGLSAWFPVPSEEAVMKLMERMGVRLLRNGDNRKTAQYGIEAWSHGNIDPKASPAEVKKKIDQLLTAAIDGKAPKIEFCNEWDMVKSREVKETRAKAYAEVVRQFKEARDGRGNSPVIIGMGLAGGDTGFLPMLAEAGATKFFEDGIAMHPGRGNTTPDAVNGSWTYLGSIRRFKEQMKACSLERLHLSEVYAGTTPNNWWKDSLRQAAENVVLTYALGLAEGARSILFYQLHDGRWLDVGGVNEKDHEYHYGLLFRDGALKPSLLAYAAAAEHFDGAKFRKRLELGGKTKGLEFETPRGTLWVLYDRTDGTEQAKKSADFVHKEGWVDHWKSRVEREFEVEGDEVTVVDAIGRKSVMKGRKVKLTLTGAPILVYGLK